jgi:multiple sugar transport system permease protein
MKKRLLHLTSGLLLVVFLAWCLAPLWWQFITSIKPDAEIATATPSYWPRQITSDHYAALFSRRPFGRYLWNSFFIATCSTLLCLAVAAPAAYSLARLRPRGGSLVAPLLIAVSFFPAITFFFPLYEIVRALGLANNPVALIVPYATFNLPLAVLFLAAFFRTIPPAVEEAGLIDGLGRIGILTRLILPLSLPGLATTSILVFISSWNEFLLALTFMPRDEARTVTVAIASLSGGSLYELPWGQIGAAIVLSAAPLLILVAIFQRRIVEGLTQSSTTG